MARVLVVDDNAANRDLVATLLGYRHHTVLQAANGAEALLMMRDDHPDLIITDLLMPVMDGYELIREVRRDPALADTAAIFYTANYLQDEVRPVARALGIKHVVSKPVEPHHLLAVVDDALAGAGTPAPPLMNEAFDREHQRAVTAKLVEKVGVLEHTEAALADSEARFRSLAQHSPIGILSMDVRGSISYANPRLLEMSGRRPANGTVLRWDELLHQDDLPLLLARLDTVVVTGNAQVDRLRLRTPDGRLSWIRVHLAPAADAGGQAAIVGTVEDITEMVEAQQSRDELEQRLRISDRLESLGELAAGIAHDFNNLLSVIVSYTEFVDVGLNRIETADPAPLEALRGDAGAIRVAADRATDLTRRLLVFARRDVVHPELIDAREVVTGAVTLLSRTIGEHVELQHHPSPVALPITCDRTQLEQVVMNLVVNARDGVGAGGTVRVSTARVDLDDVRAAELGIASGAHLLLDVTDDGSGIAPEVLSRVFEPFFTTKPSGQGTGLGLSTIYGIVTRLGGTVAIDSEVGRGTSMSVYLPLDASAVIAPATPDPRPRDVHGAGEVVLVCEDDPELRVIADRILRTHGYRTRIVDRGVAAVDVLRSDARVDLLLTDVVMPGISGRELAEIAAVTRPELPVVLMSGYAGGVFPTDGAAGPAAPDLLAKPFTQASLLDAVSRGITTKVR